MADDRPLLENNAVNNTQGCIKKHCTFKKYVCMNIARYLAVGVLILTANLLNKKETDGYTKYCCSCYYVSLDPETYGIQKNTKFDLSNCIPKCADCNYCESEYGSADAAFSNLKCNNGDYTKVKPGWIQWNWNKATGCHNDIYLSSLTIFPTDYTAYAIWVLIVTIVYSILLGVFLYLASTQHKFKTASSKLLEAIALYNIVFSEICFYLLFIPFQYYHKNISIENNKEITCEINSIHDHLDGLVSGLTWCAIAMPFIHVIMMISCCCLRRMKKEPKRNRSESSSVITVNQNSKFGSTKSKLELQDVQNDLNQSEEKDEEDAASSNLSDEEVGIHSGTAAWVVLAILVISLGFVYLVVLVIAFVLMIMAGVRNKEYDAIKISIIVVVILLLATTMDNVIYQIKIHCKRRK